MWTYQNTPINNIDDFPTGTFGFIYITTHVPTGKRYLGKKYLYHTTTKKLGKKELAEQPKTRGRAKTTKQVIKESNWKTYYGSEQFIENAIKNNQHNEFTREIIYLVPNKKLLTYYETKYQFIYEVLESDNWMNTNINGKYFSKDFE